MSGDELLQAELFPEETAHAFVARHDYQLTPRQVSARTGFTQNTLAHWRMGGRRQPPHPLPFIQVKRRVYYSASGVQDFVAAMCVDSIQWLVTAEVAAILSVSPDTVRIWRQTGLYDGELPWRTAGGKVFYDRRVVEDFASKYNPQTVRRRRRRPTSARAPLPGAAPAPAEPDPPRASTSSPHTSHAPSHFVQWLAALTTPAGWPHQGCT